jgi:hypothetical protein
LKSQQLPFGLNQIARALLSELILIRMHLPLVAFSRSIDSEVTDSTTIELYWQILHRRDGAVHGFAFDSPIARSQIQRLGTAHRVPRTLLDSRGRELPRGDAVTPGATSSGVTSRSSVRAGVGVTNNNRQWTEMIARCQAPAGTTAACPGPIVTLFSPLPVFTRKSTSPDKTSTNSSPTGCRSHHDQVAE